MRLGLVVSRTSMQARTPGNARARSQTSHANSAPDQLARELAALPREQLVARLASLETWALVGVRGAALAQRDTALAPIEAAARELLEPALRGGQGIQRLQWGREGDSGTLARVAALEQVHPCADVAELRTRAEGRGPARRIYALRLPARLAAPGAQYASEPAAFVHVALVDRWPDTLAPLMRDARVHLPPVGADPAAAAMRAGDEESGALGAARVATFYSICAPHAGLGGMRVGEQLLAGVLASLRAEQPALRQFVTLSPLPALASFVRSAPASGLPPGTDGLLRLLEQPPASWWGSAAVSSRLARLVAWYVLEARGAGGVAACAVGRFHAGNGAQLARVLPFADPSPLRCQQSWGAMVSYQYEPALLAQRAAAFRSSRHVPAHADLTLPTLPAAL